MAAQRLEDGGREHEHELRLEGLPHERHNRHGGEDAHERARVGVDDTLRPTRAQDAAGIEGAPDVSAADVGGVKVGLPHHARPAFSKCFLNMPRAM